MKKGWEYKKLEDICSKGSSNISLNKIEDNNGEFSLYGASGLVKGIDFYHQSQQYIGIVKDGSGVGRVNIYPPKTSLVGTMQYIFPKKGCEIGYLKYLLQGLHLDNFKTGAAIPHIYFKDYGKCVVPIPTITEQQQIVEELDLLSSVIEKKKAQLNELDNLAQSLFYEMFGDPITNEKGWEVKKLKEACTCITDGDHMPPPKVDKGIPFITISNIDKQNREIDFRDTFFVPQSYYDSINKERKAQIDDVLYTVTGSYGIPIIVKEDRNFCFQRHIALLRPNKHLVSPCYLCYWALCKSIKYLADDVATGIAQKTVGLSSLREFPIIIPPLSLQQQFACKIEAIEHQKELIKQSIKEVETLFNSRMDYYFN